MRHLSLAIEQILNDKQNFSLEEFTAVSKGIEIATESIRSLYLYRSSMEKTDNVKQTYGMVKKALENEAKTLNFQLSGSVSTESMSDSELRKIAVEGISDFIENVWEAIKSAFKWMWEKLVGLFSPNKEREKKKKEEKIEALMKALKEIYDSPIVIDKDKFLKAMGDQTEVLNFFHGCGKTEIEPSDVKNIIEKVRVFHQGNSKFMLNVCSAYKTAISPEKFSSDDINDVENVANKLSFAEKGNACSWLIPPMYDSQYRTSVYGDALAIYNNTEQPEKATVKNPTELSSEYGRVPLYSPFLLESKFAAFYFKKSEKFSSTEGQLTQTEMKNTFHLQTEIVTVDTKEKVKFKGIDSENIKVLLKDWLGGIMADLTTADNEYQSASEKAKDAISVLMNLQKPVMESMESTTLVAAYTPVNNYLIFVLNQLNHFLSQLVLFTVNTDKCRDAVIAYLASILQCNKISKVIP